MAHNSFFFAIFALVTILILFSKKMKPKKILFVTQEINPYVPVSPLTPFGRELPLASIEAGYETRAFMPKWGNINERRNQLHEVIRLSGINIVVDDVDHPLIIKVASVTGTRMQVYFIDNEDYFAKRLEETDASGKEYTDNFERCVFFARGVLETVKKLRWAPDVINCQGWTASAMSFLLKTEFADEPCFRSTRTIYTVTDNRLTLPAERLTSVLGEEAEKQQLAEEFGPSLTPMQMDKLAIKYADAVCATNAENQAEQLGYAESLGKSTLVVDPADPNQQLQFFERIWEKSNPDKD